MADKGPGRCHPDRGGRPQKYVFDRPDSELTEQELRHKNAILRRRQRQNRAYRQKCAKAKQKKDASSAHSQSKDSGAPSHTTAGASGPSSPKARTSLSPSEAREREEEEAVICHILDEMGEKPSSSSRLELQAEQNRASNKSSRK